MRSIHTKQQSDNAPTRAIHKHRTKLDSPSSGIMSIIVIGVALSLFAPLLVKDATFADSSVSFTVNASTPVLEVTVPSSVTIDLNPISGSAFDVTNLPITIGTNNTYGYSLFMSASSNALTRNGSITDGNGNTTTPTILPIELEESWSSGYYTEEFASSDTDEYTMNRWGYKLSSGYFYRPMSITNIQLPGTESASNATTTTLNLAAKVDSSQPAGTYSTVFSFTAVANILTLADLTGTTWRLNDTIRYTAPNGSDYITKKLNFSVAMSVADALDTGILGGQSITTWSQVPAALEQTLESYGIAVSSNTLDVIDENNNYVNFDYYSCNSNSYTLEFEYDDYGYYSFFPNNCYSFSHLPSVTGAIEFELDGDTYTLTALDLLSYYDYLPPLMDPMSVSYNYNPETNEGTYSPASFQTWTITGGDDATDISFITWLQANATRLQ